MAGSTSRVPVAKTYKIYIGGKFPRTESGRYFPLEDSNGNVVANICRGSRKDFRNAVVAARSACSGWSSAAPYLRGQILYRIAEMLEGRRDQFVAELGQQGVSKRRAGVRIDAPGRSSDPTGYDATGRRKQIIAFGGCEVYCGCGGFAQTGQVRFDGGPGTAGSWIHCLSCQSRP